ncbi:ftsH, partial [Symbiodinium sp. CCMP2456]
RRECEKSVVWGSREQLLTKFPASVWDLCICSSTARLVLDLAGQLKVKRRLALQHDYNLPLGPWGQEQTPDQLKEHRSLLKGFELLCASQHLVDFVEKWGEGDFRARCCYAADFSLFDPLPQEPLQPWEGLHSFVTFVSPCPEKGLSIFLRLAEALPDVQFLAVKTVTWTKPWHEQILKKYRNVKVQAATEPIDEVLKVTKVLLAPSVYPEAFALVVTEAQLRGIPVVSTRSGGLAEANCVAQTAVADIPIVFDPRTHELVLGMSIDEAENSLSVDRPGALTMEQWRQTAITQENYQKVAEESDVQQLMEVLQDLLAQGGGPLRQASQDARIAATSFVDRRRGRLVCTVLQSFSINWSLQLCTCWFSFNNSCMSLAAARTSWNCTMWVSVAVAVFPLQVFSKTKHSSRRVKQTSSGPSLRFSRIQKKSMA